MGEETLKIHNSLQIPLGAFRFSFSRSSGPGGQNVNKVNTKAVLRFDLEASKILSAGQKKRIVSSLGRRVSKGGEILIHCGRHRSQKQNQEECLTRFAELLRNALRRTKKRIGTKPTKASRERRLREKWLRSKIKRGRGRVNEEG